MPVKPPMGGEPGIHKPGKSADQEKKVKTSQTVWTIAGGRW